MPRRDANGGYLNIYARTPSREVSPKLRPAVMIMPGGGYEFVSDRESEPIALAFVSSGYSAFVLSYSVRSAYPIPLNEAIMAVAYIRHNAKKYSVNRDKIAAIGFSAGGHLAGLLATSSLAERQTILGNKGESDGKINAVVLSYPVIAMNDFSHESTRKIISDNGAVSYDALSVERRISSDSAPAFIWHTAEDGVVSVENLLVLASAYKKTGLPFALHIFERGCHGLSLSNKEVLDSDSDVATFKSVGKWLELALDWLKDRGFCVQTMIKE